MSTKTALIMRATGVQGRGAISHLIKAGWQIRALVRDASNDRAQSLKSFGPHVSLYQGTWKEPSTIEIALKGCQALFLNQLPSFRDDAELQEARVVLGLAKDAGVQHVVFPTVNVLNRTNVREHLKDSVVAPAILNKLDVEEVVKKSGMTWTILRPGVFLTNLLPPLVYWMYPDMKEGKFVNSYGPDGVLTVVDPDDIGAFIAAAFEDPQKFNGQTITTVSENIRCDELMKKFVNTSGQPFKVVYRTAEENEEGKNNPFIAGQLLTIDVEKLPDLEELKSWGVPLTSVDRFFEKHKHELPPLTVLEGDSSTSVPFTEKILSPKA